MRSGPVEVAIEPPTECTRHLDSIDEQSHRSSVVGAGYVCPHIGSQRRTFCGAITTSNKDIRFGPTRPITRVEIVYIGAGPFLNDDVAHTIAGGREDPCF